MNMSEHALTKELMEQGINIKHQPDPLLYIIKHKDWGKTISFTEGATVGVIFFL